MKRSYLGWSGKVDRRREGTKTRRNSETRRNGAVWEEGDYLLEDCDGKESDDG